MQKKQLIIIAVVVASVLVSALVWFFVKKPVVEVEQPAAPSKPSEQVNTIPVEERPYVLLKPDPKENGRGVTLSLSEVKKPAASGEYEIDYQTGNLLQGAFGRFKLTDFPEVVSVPFKSCSAGGKCTIHEDVTGGSILLRFDGPQKYVLKNEWSFIENKSKSDSISSRDGKFGLKGAGIARSTHLTVMQTPGLPENPELRILSSGYSVGALSAVTGTFVVSIRLNEEVQTADILAWDGQTWTTLETDVEEKIASATTAKWFEAYVAVESGL